MGTYIEAVGLRDVGFEVGASVTDTARNPQPL